MCRLPWSRQSLTSLILSCTLSLANFASPSPSKYKVDSESNVDDYLVYVVVAVVGLFVLVIIIILVVSWRQLKSPHPCRRADTNPRQAGGHQEDGFNNSCIVGSSLNHAHLWWEIPQEKLKIFSDTVLGSGQFGITLLGNVVVKDQEKKCAVRTLKGDASEEVRRSMMVELENMANVEPHPNLVNLIGARKNSDIFLVVVEYCSNGDLHQYLKKHQSDLSWLGEPDGGTSIEYVTRLRIASDVANGMNHLAAKEFTHGDLAARNVLLDGDLRAKVSNFGRSRNVSETFKTFESLRRKNEPVPTRWMPVETLRHQVFTTKSDVWSFGVLLWEIESGGIRPYDSQNTYREVVDKVVYQGYRLEQPSYCPHAMYQIMTECWKFDPAERPSFGQLAESLGKLLKENLPSSNPTLPN